MNPDEIAALMNDTAGQRWGDEAHFQRFAAAFENALQKRFVTTSMPAIKLAMEAERENGARAERAACADICDQHASVEGIAQRCAEQIRARSKT
jgi:hypothetical protein